MSDLRYALRTLARSPGLVAVAVLTLALGLGANAAIFGVLDAALFRPLLYPDADRLVTVHIAIRQDGPSPPGGQGAGFDAERFPWSYPKFAAFRRGVVSYEALAAYGSSSINLITPDGPERLQVELVSAPYFDLLGVRAVIGRGFTADEDAAPNAAPVVVLGHQLWRARFGGDSATLGQTVRLNGYPLTVVGVMPPGFAGLTGTAEAWIPIMMAPVFQYPEILEEAGNHWFPVVGRLTPGRTLDQAAAEAAVMGAEVDRRYRFPMQQGEWRAGVASLTEARVAPAVRRSVLLLGGAVGVVLLIACVNITGLLMVRAVARRRELAVRLALGAPRSRLVRQVLTEAGLLALAGAALGLVLARIGSGALLRLVPAGGRGPGSVSYLFDVSSVGVDSRVIWFALGLAVLAGLLVGLVPALQASRPEAAEMLKSGTGAVGTSRGSLRRPGAQQVLVVAEVALALLLLAGAGLLVRSFARLQSVAPGFRPEGVLSFRYSAADLDLAAQDPRLFRERLITRLSALPGVRAVSVGTCAPFSGPCNTNVVTRRDDERIPMGAGSIQIGTHVVGPDHFATLGIPVLRGRGFTDRDRAGAAKVVVLNETAARRIWPGQDPIGRRIAVSNPYFRGDSTAEVVGVVGDVRYGPVESEAAPDLYLPAYDAAWGRSGLVFLRADGGGEPLSLVPAIRRELQAIDPTLPLFNVLTLEERAAAALARPRFATMLLAIFAATALVLAAVGLYGVMAFSVTQRTREIGLRMALGAEGRVVLAGVLRHGLGLAAIGVATGAVAALALRRVLVAFLYQTSGIEPLTLAAVCLVMLGAAAVAALVPARRATRVDPMEALRGE